MADETLVGLTAAAGFQVGLTAAAGFQVGVRRTLPVTRETAWTFMTSFDGLQLWLGDISELSSHPRNKYITNDGITGEIRIVKPEEQIRMTWKKNNWIAPSTLQIRFLETSSPSRTTISFHQEMLADQRTREEMKLRWEQVLAAITERTKPFHADKG